MQNHIVILAAAALMVVLLANATHASERYAWCAYYGGIFGGASNCGFNTLDQCRATISGVGGICQPNPAYVGRSRKKVKRY